jgi:CO/xanthine dehydrogenase FAD-binding subunit
MFAAASPSLRSMRASPEYRLAMLRVLGKRALATAIERLAKRE